MLVAPLYDTVFNFDSTSKICLVCFKSKSATASKFIKVIKTSYSCNYLDRNSKKLVIRNAAGDTNSVFSVSKNIVEEYAGNTPYFKAVTKGKKYLITKDFKQLTFNDYHDIRFCDEPSFYITQNLNEAEVMVTGLVNRREEVIVPYLYSDIQVNAQDSLIIACSAGVRRNAGDDIYNYEGKIVESSYKHVVLATHHYLVLKVYEPKEYYVIHNLTTKEEKNLIADELIVYQHDEVAIRIKNEWYIYDLVSNQKKPLKKE